jgi:hypothetical protein
MGYIHIFLGTDEKKPSLKPSTYWPLYISKEERQGAT